MAMKLMKSSVIFLRSRESRLHVELGQAAAAAADVFLSHLAMGAVLLLQRKKNFIRAILSGVE